MPTTSDSVEPSRRARLRYSLLRYQAPSRSEFDGLSISSASSRGSLSIGTNSTAGTELSQSDIYDELEDLRIRQPGSGIQDSWSTRHREFLSDLACYLRQEPSLIDLKYMLKLRYISKSDSAWRSSVLIDTQSAQTKLKISSCLLKGPAIVRQLADLQLDLHVVQSRFGLSCATETTGDDISEHDQVQILVDTSTSLSGASIVVESTDTISKIFAVAGGVIELGNKNIILTALHPIKSFVRGRKRQCKTGKTCSVLDQPQCVDGAISIYHEDVADGEFRLDCADGVVDQLNLETYRDQTTKLSNLRSSHQPSSVERLKQVLTSTRMRDSKAQADSERNMRRFTSMRTSTASIGQSSLNERIKNTSLACAALLYDGMNLDWAALELSADNARHSSLLRRPNRVGGHNIDEIFDNTVGTSVDVTLATADGEISGHLSADTVLYYVDGMNLELQVVRLDAPLPRGTSGSWVAHCNKFCGMVIAVSEDVPEAYILPANALIEDMERVCDEPVRLPTASPPNPWHANSNAVSRNPQNYLKCRKCRSDRKQCIMNEETECCERCTELAHACEDDSWRTRRRKQPMSRSSVSIASDSREFGPNSENASLSFPNMEPPSCHPVGLSENLAPVEQSECYSTRADLENGLRDGDKEILRNKQSEEITLGQHELEIFLAQSRYPANVLYQQTQMNNNGFVKGLKNLYLAKSGLPQKVSTTEPSNYPSELALKWREDACNTPVILSGLGGTAKAQLALQYAQSLRDTGSDHIFWLCWEPGMVVKETLVFCKDQLRTGLRFAQLTYQNNLYKPREQLTNMIKVLLEMNVADKPKPTSYRDWYSDVAVGTFFISTPQETIHFLGTEISQSSTQTTNRYEHLAEGFYGITVDQITHKVPLAADQSHSPGSGKHLQANYDYHFKSILDLLLDSEIDRAIDLLIKRAIILPKCRVLRGLERLRFEAQKLERLWEDSPKLLTRSQIGSCNAEDASRASIVPMREQKINQSWKRRIGRKLGSPWA